MFFYLLLYQNVILFLMLLVLRVFCTFWICNLISFIIFEKFSVIISSGSSSTHLFFFFRTLITYMLNCSVFSHCSWSLWVFFAFFVCFYIFFFLFHLKNFSWCNFNSLTFSLPIFSLLMSSSKGIYVFGCFLTSISALAISVIFLNRLLFVHSGNLLSHETMIN